MTVEAVIASKAGETKGRFLPAASLGQLIWLNLAISLALAFGIWATRRGIGPGLATEVLASLIHGAIYSAVFGVGLSYLSERLALLRRPWNLFLIIVAIAAAAATGTLLIQCALLLLGYLNLANFWPEFAYKAVVVTILALLIGWGIHLYERVQTRLHWTRLKLKAEEFEKERALKLATEAQLASLESKLHPHFLFNTLNSISTLISEDPALADKIVLRLARVLRSSLDALDQNSVSLDQEIKLAVDYLEIEKARFGERLRYSLELQPGLAALPVPPLILQPLLENSVKFAVFPRPGGGNIAIAARQDSGRLLLAVRDDGPAFTFAGIAHGHGLDILRRRLQTLFRDNASLTISDGQGSKTVTVSISLTALRSWR
jgi:hypothetical protein